MQFEIVGGETIASNPVMQFGQWAEATMDEGARVVLVFKGTVEMFYFFPKEGGVATHVNSTEWFNKNVVVTKLLPIGTVLKLTL